MCFRGGAVCSGPDVGEDPAAPAEASQRHPGAQVRREEQTGDGTLPLPQEQAGGLFHPGAAGQSRSTALTTAMGIVRSRASPNGKQGVIVVIVPNTNKQQQQYNCYKN